ncbi:MAG: hypothetical protein ACOYVD_19680 [Bacillota bacterium]
MFKNEFKVSSIMTLIIITLSIMASAGGLLLEDLYRDNILVKTAWYGNDLITLFLAVPMLTLAWLYAMGGSKKAQLVWIGSLWYMVYNYIFYLYGAAFNKFFLLYVALFTLSSYALIFALINIDPSAVARQFHKRTPVKWISGYMFFFAALLGGLWVASSLSFIVTGQVPENILKTGTEFAVVYATDLSLLVPSLIVSGALLWRGRPWGYVLSAMVMIKSVTYSLVLLVMSFISYVKIGEGDPYTPLWALLSGLCFIALMFLLGNMKSSGKDNLDRDNSLVNNPA